MRIDVITIFPNMFNPIINESIIKRAQQKKKIDIRIHDLRNFSKDKHRKVDDRPFGGGPGMVMTPQPLFDSIKKVKGRRKVHVVYMCPTGTQLLQRGVKKLAKYKNIIIICGHYEGIDERVCEQLIDERVSIGDYILTGGELPAMVLIDSITRLIPGVLGKAESLVDESFESGLLEYPHYTRPAKYRGLNVPDVLLSGNHKDINKWRKEQALAKTKKYRPDLLNK